MSNVTDSVITDAKRVQQRAREVSGWVIRENPSSAREVLFEAAQTIGRLLAENERLHGELQLASPVEQTLSAEVERLHAVLKIAQHGLRRALDYRAGTPEGLAIKADIRKTLIESGDPGPWGEVGSG